MIDLHVHTTFSDGEHSPANVVEIAKLSGVHTLAITDHDSCLGVEEAIIKGEEIGVKVIPGIEVTAYENEEIHVLGYFVDYKSDKLNSYYESLKETLKVEENRIFEAFNKWGYLVSRNEIINRYAKDNPITPGNFVDWLVDNGFEKDKGYAFEKYFKHSELNYRKKDRMNVEEAINFIKSINGIPILAHPVRLDFPFDELVEKVKAWKEFGLQGIEALYSMNSEEDTNRYLKLAKDFGLGVTIGSDYHGEHVKENIKIGTGIDEGLSKYSFFDYDIKSFLGINSFVF